MKKIMSEATYEVLQYIGYRIKDNSLQCKIPKKIVNQHLGELKELISLKVINHFEYNLKGKSASIQLNPHHLFIVLAKDKRHDFTLSFETQYDSWTFCNDMSKHYWNGETDYWEISQSGMQYAFFEMPDKLGGGCFYICFDKWTPNAF